MLKQERNNEQQIRLEKDLEQRENLLCLGARSKSFGAEEGSAARASSTALGSGTTSRGAPACPG